MNNNGRCPLLIPEILEQILLNLDPDSLRQCRQVCNLWNEGATSIYRKHKSVPIFRIRLSANLEQRSEPEEFIQTMQQSSNLPVSKLILGVYRGLGEHKELLDLCAPVLTFLSLDTCNPEIATYKGKSHDLRAIVGWCEIWDQLQSLEMSCSLLYERLYDKYKEDQTPSKKLQRLKSFTIKNIRGMGHVFVPFLKTFFKIAQNLENLHFELHDYEEEDDTDFEEESDSEESDSDNRVDYPNHQLVANANLNNILSSIGQFANIKGVNKMTFNFITDMHLDALLELAKKGLKLTSFELGDKLEGQKVDRERICKFLESQKNTLTTLVFLWGENEGYIIRFPKVMPRLQVLDVYLRGRLKPSSPLLYSTVFPNLKSLYFRGSCEENEMSLWLSPQASPCHSLYHLRLPPGKVSRKQEYAQRISKLFPNIKSLDIRMPHNDFLLGVWICWPELVELKIVGFHNEKDPIDTVGGIPMDSQNLDAGITGIQSYVCLQYRNTLYGASECEKIFGVFKKHPSITGLTRLKKLTLQFCSWMLSFNACLVSDLTVYCALIKMIHLEELTITEKMQNMNIVAKNDCTTDLSEEAIRHLKTKLVNTKIRISTDSNQIVVPHPTYGKFCSVLDVDLNDGVPEVIHID